MIPLSLLSPPLRWANTHHTRWRHCSPTSHFGGPSVSPFLPSSLPTLQWGKAAQSIYFHTLVQSDTSQTLEILGAQHHPKAILPGVCAWDTCGVNPSGWAPFTTAVEECAGVWETCMGVHLCHVQVRGRRPWAGHTSDSQGRVCFPRFCWNQSEYVNKHMGLFFHAIPLFSAGSTVGASPATMKEAIMDRIGPVTRRVLVAATGAVLAAFHKVSPPPQCLHHFQALT